MNSLQGCLMLITEQEEMAAKVKKKEAKLSNRAGKERFLKMDTLRISEMKTKIAGNE